MKINRNILIGFIYLFLILLLGGFIAQTGRYLAEREEIYFDNVIDSINQRMGNLADEINNFPRSVGNDVLFLAKLDSLERLLNEEVASNRRQASLTATQNDFFEFLQANVAYYQLRYIDETGKEQVKVVFDGSEYSAVQEADLADKSDRPFFVEAMTLAKEEIYISRLDLNKEDGRIENRGTQESPIYVPVIRYATPVFTSNGDHKGIVISNIYADYFFDDIRNYQRGGENVFLVDNTGHYLANVDRKKEFAFEFGKMDDFYSDYPEASDSILGNFEQKRLDTNKHIFTFERIHPTISSFQVYKGAERVLGANPEDRYFWVLVTVSDKDAIEQGVTHLNKNFLRFSLIMGAIGLLLSFLIFVLAFKYSIKE